MYRQDCEFCEKTLTASSVPDMREQGLAHIEDRHHDEFVDQFLEKYGGGECQTGCGYEFSVGGDDVSDLQCPNCEHDNFRRFAKNYIYWEIEVE